MHLLAVQHLVQAIQRISCGWHIDNFLSGYRCRNKRSHGMRDESSNNQLKASSPSFNEHVRLFNELPQECPHYILLCALLVNQLPFDLNVTAVDDLAVRRPFTNELDQSTWLRICPSVIFDFKQH